MAYKCLYTNKKECDGCMDCRNIKNKGQLKCDICYVPIEENELYYEIKNDILCKECVNDIYGRIK